jgi:hypothetical protein
MFSSSSLPIARDAGGAAPDANHSALAPLLDVVMSEARAQGAYVYSVDPSGAIATLAVWAGLPPAPDAGPVDLQGSAKQPRFLHKAPILLYQGAWKSAGFEELPEFREHRFEGMASLPLLDSSQVIGRVNVCRSEAAAFQPREISRLLNLSYPIAALLAATVRRDTLEREIDKLTRQLADRKLFERAKSVIRSRFDWSEEEAYFCIRNMSRRRRTPMRRIAAEIIATAGSRLREDTSQT